MCHFSLDVNLFYLKDIKLVKLSKYKGQDTLHQNNNLTVGVGDVGRGGGVDGNVG